VVSAKPTLSAPAKHNASRINWRRLVIDVTSLSSTEMRNAQPEPLIREDRKFD
jgi:hypothetical protein